MLGIVLAGGRSSRMGMDKGLCEVGGISWSMLAYRKLSYFCDRVVVSINGVQRSSYLSLFSEDDLVCDRGDYGGPFSGLVSVYESVYEGLSFSGFSFFILACDMVYMRESFMSSLLSGYSLDSSYDFYLYRGEGGFIEPLCGIYRVGFVARLIGFLGDNLGRGISFRNIVNFGRGYYLRILGDEGFYFRSVNSVSDL